MAASNTTWGRALDEAKEALLRNKVSTSLSRLQSAATELASELEDKHRLDGDAQEIKVVHYTSLETAHALLTEPATQYLRLYDSVHLTDPQEGWYVFSGHDFFRSSRVSQWLESPVKEDGFSMDQLLNSECRITVGPAVRHQSDVAKSLEGILARKDRLGPKVDVSKIPYRTV